MNAPAFGRRQVQESKELHRIRAIPRRTWTEAQACQLVIEMTRVLRTPVGTQTLRPAQAIGLYEIGTYGGLAAPLIVGGGKTLLSLLSSYVLGAVNTVLILPAHLVQKTQEEMREYMIHWRIRAPRIISYQMLGRERAATDLERYPVDLIVADEVHYLKNRKAAVTRRVERLFDKRPEVRFVAMSGTLISNSLKDCAHIVRWALKDGAPVPKTNHEVEEWASALDEGGDPMRAAGPGALLSLATAEEVRDLSMVAAARSGFRRRFLETPGVVATQDEGVACSLTIEPLEYTPSAATEANFTRLRETWQTPDGWTLAEAPLVWSAARQLALGFHYAWDPRPPDEWLMARKDWARFVRGVLAESDTLDSELQVTNAVIRGELDSPEYGAWVRIRDTFTINPKAYWHDRTALDACLAWARERKGIVWTSHVFFGEELERVGGLTYYGGRGLSRTGAYIGDHPPGTAMVASVAANSTGRNLQAWNENLVTAPSSGGKWWQQLIARTHRPGQLADEVNVSVVLACHEHHDGLLRAKDNARMVQDMMGASQKLLIADIVGWPSVQEILRRPGNRWSKNAVAGTTIERTE